MPTSTRNPATVISLDPSVGDVAWSNPGNAAEGDGVFAAINCTFGNESDYLKATDFGFTIPAGATINGIVVGVTRRLAAGGGQISDREIRVVQGGFVAGDDKSTAAVWPGTNGKTSFGSETDLWGLTWTVAQINASDFGCAVRCQDSAFDDSYGELDELEIQVTYTEAGSGTSPVTQSRLVNFGGSLLI